MRRTNRKLAELSTTKPSDNDAVLFGNEICTCRAEPKYVNVFNQFCEYDVMYQSVAQWYSQEEQKPYFSYSLTR